MVLSNMQKSKKAKDLIQKLKKMDKKQLQKYEAALRKKEKQHRTLSEYTLSGLIMEDKKEQRALSKLFSPQMTEGRKGYLNHVKTACLTPVNTENPTTGGAELACADYMGEMCATDDPRWDIVSTKRLCMDANDCSYEDDGKSSTNVMIFQHKTLDIAEVYMIKDIRPPSERRSHWMIPDHKFRNVAILSKKRIGWCKWSEMCKDLYTVEKDGFFLQGTAIRDWNTGILLNMDD